MTNTLPILLKNQSILLIGGGKVALQKAKVLTDNEVNFEIISSQCIDEINALTQKIRLKNFEIEDIGDFYIVIDATGDDGVSKMLLEYKKVHALLINVVDKPALCDFYFMALSKHRPLQIAVTSHGMSPTVAKFFRDKFEKQIPDDMDSFLHERESLRKMGLIDIDETKKALLKSKVYLLGCGLGDPELLTIQAYKIVQSVDVVLYDHLISDEIMQIIPKETQKIFVGKQKGFHSIKQEAINEKLLLLANQGFSVARLKSGDPFVFGRGAEELEFLLQNDIQTEVITGISSSISAPLMANIPITARGYASSFSVVSAHLKNHKLNLDWIDLLHKENHTVVVLMGASRIEEIAKEALNQKIIPHKACAIISNASRNNQKVIKTTLEKLSLIDEKIERPAILVFGEVVDFFEISDSTPTHVNP
jgi:uroporphyrin-III C-methyltransferase/precorrin-2 dehydrogenase/sirohydrochlorin ferrochelatase